MEAVEESEGLIEDFCADLANNIGISTVQNMAKPPIISSKIYHIVQTALVASSQGRCRIVSHLGTWKCAAGQIKGR
jgi:hypothetical protein